MTLASPPDSIATQIAPSGPVARPCGSDPGSSNSLIAPSTVMRPSRFAAHSVNQSAPSGPVTIACGRQARSGSGC
ncbi:hypothetical protein [Nonomuraea harbinensis]|uniref:Uncharacterized protein n=1 Tax=Nonomuraea harbinensis TaxID=1286938 RepID=A0ABW1BYP9_9ACTN|nr:hypothetical protein [Nonomuraea harbinensis]